MRARVLLICGLAFLWPMVRGNFFVTFLGEEPSALLQLLPYIANIFVACLIALVPALRFRLARAPYAARTPALVAGILATMAAFAQMTGVLARGALADGALAAGASVGGSLVAGVSVGGSLAAGVVWAIACAACFCFLVVGWGNAALAHNSQSGIEASLVLSFLLSLPLTHFAQVVGVQYLLCALCPTLSAAVLFLVPMPSTKSSRPKELAEDSEKTPGNAAAATQDSTLQTQDLSAVHHRVLIPAPGAPVPAFLAVLAIMVAVCVLVGVINRPLSVFDDPSIFQLLCTAALVGIILVEVMRCTPGSVRLPVSLASLLFALTVGTLSASIMSGAAAQVGRELTVASRRVLWLLLFLALIGRSRHSSAQRSVYELAFLYAGCHGVSRVATALVRNLVVAQEVSQPVGDVLLVFALLAVLIIGFVIATGYALARGKALAHSPFEDVAGSARNVGGTGSDVPAVAAPSLVEQAQLVPSSLGEASWNAPRISTELVGASPSTPSFSSALTPTEQGPLQALETAVDLRHEACDVIAARLNLTERERDVMEWLSRGDTVRHIAQKHALSENTVRSHCKALYRKAEVHSRQEIMDMVDAQIQALVKTDAQVQNS